MQHLHVPLETKRNFIICNFSELSSVQYEKVCDETLNSLTEYFEELVEAAVHLSDADVSYGVCMSIERLVIFVLYICDDTFEIFVAGWCVNREFWRAAWYLRYKPSNAEQANLAFFSEIWTETL